MRLIRDISISIALFVTLLIAMILICMLHVISLLLNMINYITLPFLKAFKFAKSSKSKDTLDKETTK
jgi:hypothetical protein